VKKRAIVIVLVNVMDHATIFKQEMVIWDVDLEMEREIKDMVLVMERVMDQKIATNKTQIYLIKKKMKKEKKI
jgi:hypothetical protein